jgi:endo-alpha-1,4-polygalactosaminidase (GH114 family)
MINRAYDILPQIDPYIDMELGESVYTDYDFRAKKYDKVEPDLYQKQVELLQQAKLSNPKLKVYTLDYMDPKNTKAIAEIYQTQRSNGFIPYVATVDLDRVIPEPGAQ